MQLCFVGKNTAVILTAPALDTHRALLEPHGYRKQDPTPKVTCRKSIAFIEKYFVTPYEIFSIVF